MARLWGWWVDLWDHREHPRTLALLRIGVGLALLWDFLAVVRLGLVEVLFTPGDAGGLSDALQRDPPPGLWQVLPADETTAWLLVGGILLACVALIAGAATRPSALLLALLTAQSALILPLGDRAIDMLLRNVLLILAFSGAGRWMSLDARWRTGRWAGDGASVPAWPRHLVILQLVVMYSTAGIQKYASQWWPWGDYAALYVILHDWAVTGHELSWLDWGPAWRFTQAASFVTMVWELGTPLLLLVWLWRASGDTRRRRWADRLRAVWVAVGVVFHLGIAGLMQLGIFPWAMLATYVVFLHPDEWGAVGRRLAAMLRVSNTRVEENSVSSADEAA